MVIQVIEAAQDQTDVPDTQAPTAQMVNQDHAVQKVTKVT